MISGSNEQLQQPLEYTLPKPDCHCWWISKMQSGREATLEDRYAKKFCFKLGKNATETYGMLRSAFRPSCMNRASVFEWHKKWPRWESRQFLTDPIVQTCDFWFFPKLTGCRYVTIEEMKEAVTKVIDTLTQEDFYRAFEKLFERYNKCIAAGGDYFEGD